MAQRSQPARPRATVLDGLRGGDRRSLGAANQAAAAAQNDARQFRQLIQGMWHDDAVVRMRAADAAEKASAGNPALLAPFKAELLGLLVNEDQQEVLWHLALMVPRLPLSPAERRKAFAAFRERLRHRSSIVRTFSLQALSDLAAHQPAFGREVAEELDALLSAALQSGSAAMKARARKLLAARAATSSRERGKRRRFEGPR